MSVTVQSCYRQIERSLKVRKRWLTFLPHHAPSWLLQPLILATTCSVSWQHVTPRPVSSCPPWVSLQHSRSFQWVRLCSTMEGYAFLAVGPITQFLRLEFSNLKFGIICHRGIWTGRETDLQGSPLSHPARQSAPWHAERPSLLTQGICQGLQVSRTDPFG